MKIITKSTLYDFCNRHNYFTGGTVEQYGKMFDLNDAFNDRPNKSVISTNQHHDDLALIIWLCSPDTTRQDIRAQINDLYVEYGVEVDG